MTYEEFAITFEERQIALDALAMGSPEFIEKYQELKEFSLKHADHMIEYHDRMIADYEK